MPVSIPITASATGVTAALQEIQGAITRSGQAAKQFKDVDLSHPELIKLAADIRTVQARFDDLAKVGRGATAAAVRGIQRAGGIDPLAWAGTLNRVFPNAVDRDRHLRLVGSQIFQGTRWQQQTNPPQPPPPPIPPPAPPPAAAPPPPQAGATGATGAGLAGSIMGGLKSGLGFSLAMAGFSGVKEMASEAIGAAKDESVSNENLLRHVDETATDFDHLREAVRKAADGLALTFQESQRLAMTWAKLTNDTSPDALARGVRTGAGFSRAYGLDPEAGVNAIGRAAYMGMDANKFAALLGETARGGGQSGQIEQVMSALLRWSETATRTLVTHSNLTEFASVYAGLNATGLPGFKGENAVSLLGQINNSLSQGGSAGAAGQAFLARAMREQGVTNPYQQRRMLASGMFESAKGMGIGTSETTVFDAAVAKVKREYRDPEEMASALANLTGINPQQAFAFLTSGYRARDVQGINRALEAQHMKLEDVNPKAMRDLIEINAPEGPGGDTTQKLEAWRQKLLTRQTSRLDEPGRTVPTADELAKLAAAPPAELKTMLTQLVGKYGTEPTTGSEVRQVGADLTNALTQLGTEFLGPLNKLTEGIAASVADIARKLDAVRESTNDPNTEDWTITGGPPGTHGAGLTGMVGAEEPGLTKGVQKERAAQALAYFQTKEAGGFTREQALGIVAQAGSESGFQAHGPRGDNGLAQGAFQWHPDRAAAIEAHFGKKVADMSWEEQMRAKAWELSGQGPEAAAGARLYGAQTAYAAGYSETVYDQRPFMKNLRGVGRGAYAEYLGTQLSASDRPQPGGAPPADHAPIRIAPTEAPRIAPVDPASIPIVPNPEAGALRIGPSSPPIVPPAAPPAAPLAVPKVTPKTEPSSARSPRELGRDSYADYLGTQSAQPQVQVQVQVTPLQVIHRDAAGNLLDTENLPTMVIHPPQPWGPERSGGARAPRPPMPPPPARPAVPLPSQGP
jgi:hypothetical protein